MNLTFPIILTEQGLANVSIYITAIVSYGQF